MLMCVLAVFCCCDVSGGPSSSAAAAGGGNAPSSLELQCSLLPLWMLSPQLQQQPLGFASAS